MEILKEYLGNQSKSPILTTIFIIVEGPMKSLFFRGKTAIIGVALVAYVAWLLVGSKLVAVDENTSFVALLLSGLIGVYLIAIIVFPTIIPTNRRQLALLGIGLIIFSHSTIVDAPSQDIYLGDIIKLVGVFLIITGPLKLLISQKAIEKKQEEELEIIEV